MGARSPERLTGHDHAASSKAAFAAARYRAAAQALQWQSVQWRVQSPRHGQCRLPSDNIVVFPAQLARRDIVAACIEDRPSLDRCWPGPALVERAAAEPSG
jgi:hypothetical protein